MGIYYTEIYQSLSFLILDLMTSYSRWLCSNCFDASILSKFVCMLGIILYLWSRIQTVEN